jgi:PII-like signaling protein
MGACPAASAALTGARKILTDLARLSLDERLTRITEQQARVLERVRICKRYGQLINVPELAAGAGDRGFPLWHKLTACTWEAARYEAQPIHRAIVRRLRPAGFSGAATHRGFWGFHGDRPPHGDRLLQPGRRVPTATTVTGTAERIVAAFDSSTSSPGNADRSPARPYPRCARPRESATDRPRTSRRH